MKSIRGNIHITLISYMEFLEFYYNLPKDSNVHVGTQLQLYVRCILKYINVKEICAR